MLILVGAFYYGCGYTLRGTGTFLPQHIKTIYVREFQNNTTRFDLEKIVTDEVRKEFSKRKDLSISNREESSDSILEGEIKNFSVVPVGIQESSASRYRVRITLSVELFDKVKKKVIYKNPSFFFEDEYEMEGEVDFLSLEDETIRKVSEKMAKSLVSTILEGF